MGKGEYMKLDKTMDIIIQCVLISDLNDDEKKNIIESLRNYEKEYKRLKVFYNYFSELYGQGLEVANWHLNGDLEPFDEFYEHAEYEMNQVG